MTIPDFPPDNMLTALPVQCELGQMTGAIIDIHLVFIVFRRVQFIQSRFFEQYLS